MKKIVPLFISLLLLFSCQNTKQEQQLIHQVETHLMPAMAFEGEPTPTYDINERMGHYKVPGISIAFIDEGRIAWTRCYGYHSFDSLKKVTPQSLFQAASISKPVAAMGALALVEDSLLMLDGDVNDLLTRWKVPVNGYTSPEPVTLRRLMTHTAGLTVHGFPGYSRGDTVPSVVEVLNGQAPANTPAVYLDTLPGSLWRYSGGGYTVMQLMMEDVTEKSFDQLMKERVLAPLQMEHSTYSQPLPTRFHEQAALAHDEQGKKIEGGWHVYPEQAAAGLWTTPSDLARYMIEVQNAYQGKSNRIITPSMARRMLTDHKGDWGLGPALQGNDDSLAFQHGGANAGYRALFFAFAQQDQGVAIMTNSDIGRDLIDEVMRSISHVYGWGLFKTQKKARGAMEPSEMKALEGEYELSPRMRVTVKAKQEHLTITPSWNGQSMVFYPGADSTFFNLEKGWSLRFNKSKDQGEVMGFSLNESTYFTKVQ
jgi:CubicO group peptidase (beta-lactamase class C family)